jgi:hypothetical protein
LPFIRQTRDKRGFEHTYVMHAGRPGSGQPRPRVLYVFRSPGNLRVGRKALEGEVREALEHTHPDLSFDWNSLEREAVVSRPEQPAPRQQRQSKPRPQAQAPPPQQAPTTTPPAAEDFSLLGRTLGPPTAARIRARFSEISQRIARRARTSEEREALLDRMRPLNPDAWPDEAGVREQVVTFDSALDALAAEVPSRRRGRRGGRHRHEQPRESTPSGASGIMAVSEASHENPTDASLDRPDSPPDAGSSAGVSAADTAEGLPSDD